jgi:hypothetical protein
MATIAIALTARPAWKALSSGIREPGERGCKEGNRPPSLVRTRGEERFVQRTTNTYSDARFAGC